MRGWHTNFQKVTDDDMSRAARQRALSVGTRLNKRETSSHRFFSLSFCISSRRRRFFFYLARLLSAARLTQVVT